MVDKTVERMQDIRDLRGQIDELKRIEDDREIIFKETSPRRRKVTIYSMANGEPLDIPAYMAERVLDKQDANGYMFTARKEEAPEYKLGTTLCFLHADSPDQEILRELGLSGVHCPKKTLANPYAKRMHALHRHPTEWAMYQEFVEERKERRLSERQEQQLAATLAIANAAGAVTKDAPEEVSCPDCTYTGTPRQLQGHRMGAHKAT